MSIVEIVEIPTAELTPSREDILAQQGVPPGTQLRTDIEKTCTRSLELLQDTAAIVGVVSEIFLQEFAVVFEGEGENEADTG